MPLVSKARLKVFQQQLAKISVIESFNVALPELDIPPHDVVMALRKAHLRITPNNVARTVCSTIADVVSEEKINDLLGLLRLRAVAVGSFREWYTIILSEPTTNEPLSSLIRMIPSRVLESIRATSQRSRSYPEVHATKNDQFLFMSIAFVTGMKQSTPVYVALSPSHPVAYVSSLGNKGLLQAITEGAGYQSYSNAKLQGKNLNSLQQIIARTWNHRGEPEIPEYSEAPVITPNGIDYIKMDYNLSYVENIIGRDPPVLTKLDMTWKTKFPNPKYLNKEMMINMNLNCDDVAEALKTWVKHKALPPTSDLIKIFGKMTSNRIMMTDE